jgi:hypothetical protein
MNVAGSQPYPWPYDGVVEADSLALLIVQGARPATQVHIQALRTLAADVGAAGGLVVAVVHGAADVLVAGDEVVRAPAYDGFYATALDDLLRRAGRDHLALAGWHFEIEVHSAMRSANDRGYECLALTDVSLPADPSLAPAASSMICMSGGIFGAVATSASLVAALGPVPALQEESA